MASITEARKKANETYLKTQDEIKIRVPKGRKAEIQAHAGEQGESVNGFIGRAIDETIARDLNQPLRSVLRREKVSGIELPLETEKVAKIAAEKAKESVNAFIARAIETQIERDGRLLRIGVNPATGEKLAKASEEKAADSDKDKPADGQAGE